MLTRSPLQPSNRSLAPGIYAGSPFDPYHNSAYEAWREQKLDRYPTTLDALLVEIRNPHRLSRVEQDAIHYRVRKTNMALYTCKGSSGPDRQLPAMLGRQCGLTTLDCNRGADDDGITTLQVTEGEWRSDYIPYTNRPIHWHTDGYYNEPSRQIQALQLHCVSPAASGGANALLDHEIAYLHLRDTNPDFIHALMQPDVMTIPANRNGDTELRPARSGPVFSIQPDGNLHMRYTARPRNVEWAPDPLVRAALDALDRFLQSDCPYIFRATLQAGQGLISNNVLHDRTGFTDSDSCRRQIYRLRYYQRIART
jgi:alpha-ketoglutarate-dependent taurine dioxygenase